MDDYKVYIKRKPMVYKWVAGDLELILVGYTLDRISHKWTSPTQLPSTKSV